MAAPSDSSPSNSYGLELVVSTWHISQLHDNAQPEGLPTDLLTRHSALFYLVDRVVCDSFGFQGELKFGDYWLSAKMFKELKRVGLIREVDLHAEPYTPPGFWSQLKASQTGLQALKIMEESAAKLDQKEIGQIEGIDASLLTLNRSLFLNLRIPDNWLPYYQTDAHLKLDPTRQVELASLPGAAIGEMRWRAQRLSRLLELVERCLPDPQLLPRMRRPSQRGALTYLTNHEKPHLYKVIYGAMSHDEFQNIRRDRKRFRGWDELIDTRDREEAAYRNLETLVAIRKQTEDVRSGLQRSVIGFADGEIPLSEARTLMNTQVSQLQQHISGALPAPYRLGRLFTTDLGPELVDFFLSQWIPGYPYKPLGPFNLGPATVAGRMFKNRIDHLESGKVQPHVRRFMYNRARPDYPWAALLQDMYEILGKGSLLDFGA